MTPAENDNTNLFKSNSEAFQFGGIVQFSAVDQSPGPRVYGGYGVGGGGFALLVHAVVASDGAVCGF